MLNDPKRKKEKELSKVFTKLWGKLEKRVHKEHFFWQVGGKKNATKFFRKYLEDYLCGAEPADTLSYEAIFDYAMRIVEYESLFCADLAYQSSYLARWQIREFKDEGETCKVRKERDSIQQKIDKIHHDQHESFLLLQEWDKLYREVKDRGDENVDKKK